MTWRGKYSPEPLNDGSSLTQQIRTVATDLIQSQSVFGSMVPASIPFNTVQRPLVTELPVSPADGDEVRFLADADSGVVWQLRYRDKAPSAYRWEFIGGSPIYAEVTTEENYGPGAGGATFGDLATSGPAVTLPLAGDYDVQHGCRAHVNGNAGFSLMSYAIGSTAASDNDAVIANEPAGDNTSPKSMARMRRKTGLSAVTLTSKYRNNNTTNTGAFSSRWISVTPIRVGRV